MEHHKNSTGYGKRIIDRWIYGILQQGGIAAWLKKYELLSATWKKGSSSYTCKRASTQQESRLTASINFLT